MQNLNTRSGALGSNSVLPSQGRATPNDGNNSRLSRQRSNETLKKQINYVNYTRQNFDSVSMRRLNQVFQKLNQCRAFDRLQKRPMTYLEMQEHEKRLNRSTQNATRQAPKNPQNLEQMRELLNTSLK